MKTKSTNTVLLNDGTYQGFWGDKIVSIPFPDEEIIFQVKDYVPGPVHKCWITVKDKKAVVYTQE